jgi:hypothetical protein
MVVLVDTNSPPTIYEISRVTIFVIQRIMSFFSISLFTSSMKFTYLAPPFMICISEINIM